MALGTAVCRHVILFRRAGEIYGTLTSLRCINAEITCKNLNKEKGTFLKYQKNYSELTEATFFILENNQITKVKLFCNVKITGVYQVRM